MAFSFTRIAFYLAAATFAFAARYDLNSPGKTVRLSDPQISPNGKSIALVASKANFDDNRWEAELLLVDVTSHANRLLSARRGLTQPSWSPSGDQLGFLSTVDGKMQIFTLPLSGGEAVQITKAPSGVQHYAWSPDGSQIAFVTSDELAAKTGVERHNRSFEAADNDYLQTAQPMPAHVWVIPSAGGKPRRITSGTWSVPVTMPPGAPSSPLSWSPDGKSLVIAKTATPYSGDSNQRAIQIVDVASGHMRALTGRTKNESQPQFSPDGRHIAYWFPRDGEGKNVNEIYLSPVSGGEGRPLTRPLDQNIQRAIWMPDSKSLLVSSNAGTTVGIWIQPLDGPAQRLELGKLVPSAAFWLDAAVSDTRQIAMLASEPRHPTELYFMESPTAQPVRLTNFNKEIASLDLGKTETVEWKGPDNFTNNGVLTFPPDFSPSKKWPLVLYIHGGPSSASKESFSSRAQLLAAQGWVVFEPNYRGSDNGGNAYKAAINNDAGAGPGRDVMAGVELLKKRGYIDEKRMATSGWSYGGYMTAWLLGNYPKEWKAGIAGAPVTDWLDQYNIGDSNVARGNAFGGSPWTDERRMQAYVEQSPITYAPKIKAPTLILCNTGDYRVPITQSYKLYHALRDNGIETKFVAYPLGGHSPTDPVHMRDVDRRWVDWLKKHLGS